MSMNMLWLKIFTHSTYRQLSVHTYLDFDSWNRGTRISKMATKEKISSKDQLIFVLSSRKKDKSVENHYSFHSSLGIYKYIIILYMDVVESETITRLSMFMFV